MDVNQKQRKWKLSVQIKSRVELMFNGEDMVREIILQRNDGKKRDRMN